MSYKLNFSQNNVKLDYSIELQVTDHKLYIRRVNNHQGCNDVNSLATVKNQTILNLKGKQFKCIKVVPNATLYEYHCDWRYDQAHESVLLSCQTKYLDLLYDGEHNLLLERINSIIL